jgi:hypothetical protein
MGDFTVEEEMQYSARRAREVAAEKYFFDLNQPFFPLGFSVGYRNPGHWDIYADSVPGRASAWRAANPEGITTEQDGMRERAFCIRGEPDNVHVRDERWNPHKPYPRESLKFRSVMGAMIWIMEELMQEPTK